MKRGDKAQHFVSIELILFVFEQKSRYIPALDNEENPDGCQNGSRQEVKRQDGRSGIGKNIPYSN
ncbi:MAG: hypothetical protein ABSA83_09185 [Verrucomicrobiota bacterium]|jgi:hypothetical protein